MKLLIICLSICLSGTLTAADKYCKNKTVVSDEVRLLGDDQPDVETRQFGRWFFDDILRFYNQPNCDLPGNAYRTFNTDERSCGQRCRSDTRCTYLTWDRSRRTCRLKSGFVSPSQAFPRRGFTCAIKAEFFRDGVDRSVEDVAVVDDDNLQEVVRAPFDWKKDPEIKVIYANGCDLAGKELSNVKSTVSQCGSRCRQREKCTIFYWNNGRCSLRSGKPKRRNAKRKNGALCGFKIEHEVRVLVDDEDETGVEDQDDEIDWQEDEKLGVTFADNCSFGDENFLTINSTISQCVSNCAQNPKCTHFIYEDESNECGLKEGSVSRNEANKQDNTICGFKTSAESDEPENDEQSLTELDDDDDDDDGNLIAEPDNFVPCTRRGVVPNTQCKFYYACIFNQQVIFSCMNNFYYNEVLRKCLPLPKDNTKVCFK